MGRPLMKIQTSIVLSALSLALSAILESWLKFAFETPQTHFYQCETCDHIQTVEQKLDHAADRTLE